MTGEKIIVAVVDDDTSLQKGIRRLLIAHGFAVETYFSAEEFLSRSPTNQPNCLLLDNRLGGISGIELLRSLAEADSHLPVIFMTAAHNENVQDQAMALGCVEYLAKPFLPSVLINAIKRVACDASRGGFRHDRHERSIADDPRCQSGDGADLSRYR